MSPSKQCTMLFCGSWTKRDISGYCWIMGPEHLGKKCCINRYNAIGNTIILFSHKIWAVCTAIKCFNHNSIQLSANVSFIDSGCFCPLVFLQNAVDHAVVTEGLNNDGISSSSICTSVNGSMIHTRFQRCLLHLCCFRWSLAEVSEMAAVKNCGLCDLLSCCLRVMDGSQDPSVSTARRSCVDRPRFDFLEGGKYRCAANLQNAGVELVCTKMTDYPGLG